MDSALIYNLLFKLRYVMYKPTVASRFIFYITCFLSVTTLLSCSSVAPKQEVKADDFTLKIIGINDFHGQVLPKDDKGGMYNLSAHLLQAIESTSDYSFVLHAGDHVGASPAESALLQDEPSISFLNTLSQYCIDTREQTCQVIGTAGNHEFDEGSAEMMRLLQGGNHQKGPFLDAQWAGANYKMLSANVIDQETKAPLLPSYVVHKVNGVDIGFIGLTLDSTPELVVPGAVENLVFEDQAEVANHVVKVLQEQGVNAIIIIVHDGTEADYYSGNTKQKVGIDTLSQFGTFLSKLPNTVDLVVTGHSHNFTNAYFTRNNGTPLLVTQAFSSGRAYADITLTMNTVSKDVTASVAQVMLVNDAPTASLSIGATATLGKLQRLIGDAVDYAQTYTQAYISIYKPSANDIPLGQFIANSHQYSLQTDMAIMNKGGVRADLKAGELVWGDLFAVQPFSNQLVVREYTGEQLLRLIDDKQYWSSDVVIEESGQMILRGKPIELGHTYTVGGNNYIMNSAGFSVGKHVRLGGLDIDATVDYIKRLDAPFNLRDTPK